MKIGLYGAGDIADLHVSGINNCSSAELVGLFDIDQQKAKQKAKKYKKKRISRQQKKNH